MNSLEIGVEVKDKFMAETFQPRDVVIHDGADVVVL